MWKRLAERLLLPAVSVLLLAGCGDDDTPESRLRQSIDLIQQYAEERNLGDLMEFVSTDYQDAQGRNWKDIRALAQLQFIRNPKIHTLKRINLLRLDDDNHASVRILVAVAGRPIDNASALSGLRADLIRFDLEFQYSDRWQIVGAMWRRAQASEFLN
ncbi:MAG: hypothetical protein WBM41_19165 [Arenicellales bacterium]